MYVVEAGAGKAHHVLVHIGRKDLLETADHLTHCSNAIYESYCEGKHSREEDPSGKARENSCSLLCTFCKDWEKRRLWPLTTSTNALIYCNFCKASTCSVDMGGGGGGGFDQNRDGKL